MSQYDFSTLNSTDLEELVCDLLNADLPSGSEVRYRTFKAGKDKGIDILHSLSAKIYCHVGQVKHYLKSGIKKMLKDLVLEATKVQKLDPDRYIIASSLELGIHDVESIIKIFHPYLKNASDVYGKKELNSLLDKHPAVLSRHFKLWLSSTAVLEKILHSELENRTSHFIAKELSRSIRLYVKTESLDACLAILKDKKFLIITGEPGVGKTTLADMVAYRYVADEFQLAYIADDISEAEKALKNDDSKQIIYFDDFLGSTEVEINKSLGSDSALRRIVKRIETSTNKYLILTTRSHLFSSAQESSEKLRSLNISKGENQVQLNEYNAEVKRAILSVHIEESGLKPELAERLKEKHLFEHIIEHANFFPRTAEFITSADRTSHYSPDEFESFIKSILENPKDIWLHAYENQISEDDRILLNTMMSFGPHLLVSDLEGAFNSRINYEVEKGGKERKIGSFNKTLNRLDGGFIEISTLYGRTVKFVNPSLKDFLSSHIKNDPEEMKRITESACRAPQLSQLFLSLNSKTAMPASLKHALLHHYYSFASADRTDSDLITVALVLFKRISLAESEPVICEIIEAVDSWESLHHNYSLNLQFREFTNASWKSPKITSALKEKIFEILEELVGGEDDIEDAVDLVDSFIHKYDIDLSDQDTESLKERFDYLLEDKVDQEIDNLKEYIEDESEADDMRSEIENYIIRLRNASIEVDDWLKEFDDNNWAEISTENYIRRISAKD